MSWRTALLREVKGLADDVVYRVAKQFEGSAQTTDNVAKAARMAKRLQARKAAAPPTKPLARAPSKPVDLKVNVPCSCGG